MTSTSDGTLANHAFMTGQYYLIPVDTVIEYYRKAGFNVDDEEEDVPTVLKIDGMECFFTGDHIRRNDKYYEIVVAAKDFSWDEVEGDEVEEDEDE